MKRTFPFTAAAILGAGLVALPAAGTEVKVFQTQSQSGFLAGTLEGVGVDSLGRMELAPRAERVGSLSEPFLLAAAVHPDGWVVGTGNAGKVLKVDRRGEVVELFAAPEPEVFAVLADPDGTVYAGTSPRGKVYRIPPGGQAEELFDPGETYIWSLARGAGGALLVATGTQGKVFTVDPKGKGSVLYDSDDTHVRALETLPGGDVLLGTAGEGLVLRLAADGSVRTVYDAEEPEVVSLATAPDGTAYAAVVASESSLVDLSKKPAAASAGAEPGEKESGGAGEPQVTVTVVEGDDSTPAFTGSRRPGATGPRSQVLSISPVGVVENLWSFDSETVYDLLWQDGRLWVATGLEGKLFSWADGQMLLEKDVDERQVVTLLPGQPRPAFGTTNAAALFRIVEGTEPRGTYTSASLDAGQVARFGSFRWRGDLPKGAGARFAFRTGVSSEPDRTWSEWTEAREGTEISLADLPRGRYVQWRADLEGGRGGGSPRLYGVELSYRQENLKPRIDRLVPLQPGQILVPANFNPGNQVFEPAHPNREGIFTTLRPSTGDEDAGSRVKPLWKRGFQTLRWSASDPNQDPLVYELSFRPAESDGEWLPVAAELEQDYYGFDATALPDGVYRFRLLASDAPSNDLGQAQAAERVSDSVVIDHTPPELVKVERRGERLEVTVRDAANPLREAVVSRNAEEWKPVPSADGLLDGRTEVLSVEAGEKGGLLLLRVTDAAHNVITFNLSGER